MKQGGGVYQASTQVKVLSPEIKRVNFALYAGCYAACELVVSFRGLTALEWIGVNGENQSERLITA